MSVQFVEEYRTVDKSKWGDGAWNDEPDKAVWVDAETNLDCMIVRNRLGALCGYVGVPEGHPAHGVDCDNVRISENEWPDVHGGLTFAAACHEGDDPSQFICHIPQAGRPDKVWWFGFDCAHSGDLCPSMKEYGFSDHDSYKDFPYVIRDVESLAKQLSDV